MIVIACVDDNNGMMFNHRRQSSDRLLTERILKLAEGKVLWCSSYSESLFKPADVKVDDDFMRKASTGDFCFVENTNISPYEADVEKIILFKWNRKYPHDTEFPLALDCWRFISTEDFAGYSHEKITEEIYTKGEKSHD